MFFIQLHLCTHLTIVQSQLLYFSRQFSGRLTLSLSFWDYLAILKLNMSLLQCQLFSAKCFTGCDLRGSLLLLLLPNPILQPTWTNSGIFWVLKPRWSFLVNWSADLSSQYCSVQALRCWFANDECSMKDKHFKQWSQLCDMNSMFRPWGCLAT